MQFNYVLAIFYIQFIRQTASSQTTTALFMRLGLGRNPLQGLVVPFPPDVFNNKADYEQENNGYPGQHFAINDCLTKQQGKQGQVQDDGAYQDPLLGASLLC